MSTVERRLAGSARVVGFRWLVLLALLLTACATPEPEPAAERSPAERSEEDVGPPTAEEAIEQEGSPERPAPATPAIATPVRAVWVHLFDDTLKSRAGIEALVEELVEAEATLVIAQVVRRHDAYYRSQVLPRTVDPKLEEDLDVLEVLVPLARDHGIEVHAWVSMAPTWHRVYDELETPAGWLPAEHGRDAPEDRRWVTRTAEGEWSEYLDPALPQVRDHLAAIAVELAATTAVEGIHLDYVRYESAEHGYHPDAIARYLDEVDAETEPEPDDPEFLAWRRKQTHDVVAHVDAALAGVDRPVALSAAVTTWGPGPAGTDEGSFDATLPAVQALQDWPGWAREGLVDVLFPMNYFRGHVAEQARWFQQWLDLEAELATATDTLIVPGIGGWLNEPDAVLGQVGAATMSADGAAIYSFQQPTDDAKHELWRDLAETGWTIP